MRGKNLQTFYTLFFQCAQNGVTLSVTEHRIFFRKPSSSTKSPPPLDRTLEHHQDMAYDQHLDAMLPPPEISKDPTKPNPQPRMLVQGLIASSMNQNHTGNQISSIAISNTIVFCNKEYHQKNDLQVTTKSGKLHPHTQSIDLAI